MNDELEHYRVFSKLTGLAYFQAVEGKKYMIVGGMCLPAHIGICLVLYVMTGNGAYKEALGQQINQDVLIKLNPEYEWIKKFRRDSPWETVNKLHGRMTAVMSEWRAEDFDAIVSEHRAAFHSNLLLGG